MSPPQEFLSPVDLMSDMSIGAVFSALAGVLSTAALALVIGCVWQVCKLCCSKLSSSSTDFAGSEWRDARDIDSRLAGGSEERKGGGFPGQSPSNIGRPEGHGAAASPMQSEAGSSRTNWSEGVEGLDDLAEALTCTPRVLSAEDLSLQSPPSQSHAVTGVFREEDKPPTKEDPLEPA